MDLCQDVHSRWLAAMRAGDFEAAWQQTDRIEFLRRKEQKEAGFCVLPSHLRWNGDRWESRKILIRCLHGLGDTIQFIRYLPLLRRSAATTYVMAQPALLAFLHCSQDLGPVLNGWSDSIGPDHELEMEIMELPYVFRARLETVPNRVPYFDTKTIRKSGRVNIPRSGGDTIRVGLVWASSQWDSSRSLPVECMEEWRSLSNVEWFSLQQGSENYVNQLPILVHSLAGQTQEITQVAAAMLDLDLIISVDTLTAHLAGALGRPVWLMLSNQPDWRWLSSGDSSAWYPTMRIFRCPGPGEWQALTRVIAQELSKYKTS